MRPRWMELPAATNPAQARSQLAIMSGIAGPNSQAALIERREAGTLAWPGPALMLFGRPAFAVLAQAIVALIFANRGSATPWSEAGAWIPVYGALIDVGCLASLWWLTHKEGIRLRDLVDFDRRRLARDLLFGLLLIPPSLVLILAGNYGSSLLIYGDLSAPDILKPLPLPAALYGVLIFPLVWGITEQMTYNGYLAPRLQVLSRSTWVAVALVAALWSFQHALMPLTFDPNFMLYRALAPIPFSTFQVLLYLRTRRLVPLATAHWLMDGGDAFFRMLWPLL